MSYRPLVGPPEPETSGIDTTRSSSFRSVVWPATEAPVPAPIDTIAGYDQGDGVDDPAPQTALLRFASVSLRQAVPIRLCGWRLNAQNSARGRRYGRLVRAHCLRRLVCTVQWLGRQPRRPSPWHGGRRLLSSLLASSALAPLAPMASPVLAARLPLIPHQPFPDTLTV
jgi:hypothetical protein